MEKVAQHSSIEQTECFTMSQQPMENKPTPPEPHLPAQSMERPASSPVPAETRTGVFPSPLRKFLTSPDGILVLPRWFFYLVLAWIIFQTEGWLLVSLRNLHSLAWRMTVEASMMLAAILPGSVMARIEGQPFGSFGLPARQAFRKNFWIGALWGITSLTALILALHATGSFEFGSIALHSPRIWKFALYYALFFLLTAFFEEFLVRGYSQWVLSRGFTFWPTAVFLSIGFGLIHTTNPGETKAGLAAAATIGLFLCLTLRRTGDLWWAVGFHMAWDWGETFLYSVPDSGSVLPGHLLNSTLHGPDWLTGGSVGPEGSYLIFPLIAVLWITFAHIYSKILSSRPK
jgi:uncharacterized protein